MRIVDETAFDALPRQAMTKIKICGLKDHAMLRAASEAGADYLGLMFVPESPRAVSIGQADMLLPATGLATGVAVVADADDHLIDAIRFTGFPIIQLHGNETPERAREIKDRTGMEVWKAIGVREKADLAICAAYDAANHLLIDAKAPEGEKMAGGHGTAFDWSILKDWEAPKPWLLAGGLTPDNVRDAISATGAPGVDVSSGVEGERGVKDVAKIEAFIKAVKAA